MADNKQNLADAISGWQSVTDAVGGLGDKLRSGIANILSYPDNFEARRQFQNDFSSYAREAGDLSTQLDSPGFESAVANKYSGFQAGQTNLMTAAANEIARADIANERSNRKIDNLNQQKEINDKIVNDSKNFMKAISAPPVVGTILGLFNSDYSVSDQMQNLAYDSSQLENLKTQDALDDELILQKAFGKVGYNPLANDVIEPANRWEKQYYDELTSLQRNKISATSNKIAAKGGELEAYKAETARLKALSDILGDESQNARTVYGEFGKANERDRDYAQMNVDVFKERSRNERKLADMDIAMGNWVNDQLNNESAEGIAELKRANAIDALAGKQLTAETKKLEIAQEQKHDKSQEKIQASKEIIEASKKERNLASIENSRYTAELNLKGKEYDLRKEELKNERAKSGKAGGATADELKAPTSEQVSTIVGNGGQAISDASKLITQKAVILGLNGQLLGNNPAIQQAFNELETDAKLLVKSNANGNVVSALASDPEAYAAYKAAIKRTSNNVEFITKEAEKVFGTGTSQSKEVTSIRLSNGGIVPASQRAVAENYLVSTDERSSSGTSIEGSIWNDKGFQNALWVSMQQRWASLPAETKGMVTKTTGIDPKDEKAVEQAVAQMIINMAEGGSVSGKGGGKDTKTYELAYKALNPRAVLNDLVTKGFSYSYVKGTNPDGTQVIETKHTSGKQLYDNALSLDMTNYKASRIADNFNQQNGASIDTTFIGDENAEYTLGKRIIDAGFSPELAINLVDQFRLAPLTKAWAEDYQQRSVANDNIAASLMPVLGFTEFVNTVINDDSGQGNNASSVNQQYDNIKGQLAAYGNIKIKEANYAETVMNFINQARKGK